MEVNKMKRLVTAMIALAVMLCAFIELPVRAYGSGMNYHNEVIVMVDSSYSTEEHWNTVRNGIIKVGTNVLDGSTMLTVMAFGTADNIVLKHASTVRELENSLSRDAGTILYGGSMTNCEAGFAGITEYINNHDESLGKVYVVFITDGEINADETTYAFSNWKQNNWLKRDAATLARWSIEEEAASNSKGSTYLSDAYLLTIGGADIETLDDETVLLWADSVWNYVYAYSGMTMGREYPISDTERAFIRYDKEHNTHVQEIFYYTIWGRNYPDAQNRTYSAGIALANNSKVTRLDMIDTNETSSWMRDMERNSNKVSLREAGSVYNLSNQLDIIIANGIFEKNEPTKPLEPEATKPQVTQPVATQPVATQPEIVWTEPTKMEQETVNICGRIVWEDGNDQYEKRPVEVVVAVYDGNAKMAFKIVTAKEQWKYSFDNLPKYDSNGEMIVYTVREGKISEYYVRNDGYNIINVYDKPIEYSTIPENTQNKPNESPTVPESNTNKYIEYPSVYNNTLTNNFSVYILLILLGVIIVVLCVLLCCIIMGKKKK